MFKKFFNFFKKFVPNEISQTNQHFKILDGHGSHVFLKSRDQAHQFGLDLFTFPNHTSHALVYRHMKFQTFQDNILKGKR